MELDDLKKMVDISTQNYEPLNNKIMELISHKSQSPLSRLEQNIKIGLVPFPLAALLFTATFINSIQARHSILHWMLFCILFIEFINLLFSYGLVKKLLDPSGSTKENLVSKISRIKRSFTSQFLISLCSYAAMAIVLEITMYYHADANFSTWYETPILLRITCYIAFLIFQLILKKHFYKKQFSGLLEELNNLIQQLK